MLINKTEFMTVSRVVCAVLVKRAPTARRRDPAQPRFGPIEMGNFLMCAKQFVLPLPLSLALSHSHSHCDRKIPTTCLGSINAALAQRHLNAADIAREGGLGGSGGVRIRSGIYESHTGFPDPTNKVNTYLYLRTHIISHISY